MGKSYEDRRAGINAYQKQQSHEGRDIGPLPAVADPARREACRLNLQKFCETYFSEVFKLEWSQDHLDAIRDIQTSTLEGGLFAMAFPRGSGKTSLLIVAAEWALVYGHRSFIVLIGASEDAAKDLLENLKTDFETNDILNEDFPDVCYPIRQLERITHRAKGQLLNGEPTRMSWTANELVLPTIAGATSSGAVVKVAGITGRIRGLAAQRPSDGSKIRPDFVLIDDPQTDESGRSPKQVRDRMQTVAGAILGLSGPGKKISGFAAVTVIAKNDVADQLLNQKLFPQWQGKRVKLLKSLPKNVKRWEEYAEIRAQGLRSGQGLTSATAFYVEHQTEMDDGAEASWLARFNKDEASAIQHGMNLKLSSEEAFAAEYQNEPLSLEASSVLIIRSEQVTAKVVAYDRGVVPIYVTKLVCHIDVHGDVLFYTVCGFGDNYTGHVVDYGCWPDQKRNYFFKDQASPVMTDMIKGVAPEAAVRHGIDSLINRLMTTDWRREDGKTQQIDRLLIDSGWNGALVKQAVRESQHRARLIPCKGWGGTADKKPMDDWKLVQGDRRGWSWVIRRDDGVVMFDTNSWKTFAATRILSSAGEAGNLSIFNGSPTAHKMFADHVCSEYATPTEGMGRQVNVWAHRPNTDNHWFDNVVGCYVAASEQGITFLGHQSQPAAKKRRKLQVNF